MLSLIGIAVAVHEIPALSEPYPLLHGNNPAGLPAVVASPDPLVSTTWNSTTNVTGLQRYSHSAAVAWKATPPSAFRGLETLAAGQQTSVVVVAPGTLRLDFGVEHAAWFEFVANFSTRSDVTASISEYNEPWPGKTMTPTVYTHAGGGNGTFTYRLETNSQLYEGVRYAWITIDANARTPTHISDFRLVSQVKATNYTGSFESSDAVLMQSWYSGAYGSRLNMMPHSFNSILMDRGDRVSIQGDGHPTMAAALVAFAGSETLELVHEMLAKTDSGCAVPKNCPVVDSALLPYPLYWCSSVNDWFLASGDRHAFEAFAPDMARIIDNAVVQFMAPDLQIKWFGWDDRVGNGFGSTLNLEAQLSFAALTIRACGDFAQTLALAGDALNATRYTATAKALAAKLRARPATTVPEGAWWEDYGVHAAAYMLNAKIVATANESDAVFHRVLANARTICSWSPFNQYWILQALGNIGKMDYAAASIRLCWGPMLSLGKGCFWELFSPEWTRWMKDGDKAPTRPSYCHPWSSGVTHWLTHAMAGLKALAPGYARFAALPHVSGANPTVRATVATPHGAIAVDAACDTGAATVTVATRAPVAGVVGLRIRDEATGCALDLSSAMLDGVAVATLTRASAGIAEGALHPIVAAEHAFVRVGQGVHTVAAAFSAECAAAIAAQAVDAAPSIGAAAAALAAADGNLPSAPPFAPATYPASWTLDNATRGQWRGAYGGAGYELLGFNADSSSVTKLPSWVSAVSLWRGNRAHFVGRDARNASFLVDPRGGDAALGFVSDGADGSQGTVVDIVTTPGVKYRISLYMVSDVRPVGARTSSFTKQAIRTMDLATLDPIAPGALIPAARGGVYWTLAYDRSVRIRMMPIDSDAGCSAIFFDAYTPA
jgi:hypothetical protein